MVTTETGCMECGQTYTETMHVGQCPGPRTYAIDNRWSPGSSGFLVPRLASAVYNARWIDRGENPADVVPDRQGFACNEPAEKTALAEALAKYRPDLHASAVPVGQRQMLFSLDVFGRQFKIVARRDGGYFYVDAWLVPAGLLDDHGRPRGVYAHGATETDTRFGWIGDMSSGTLTCLWPGCGAELFGHTGTPAFAQEADAHWLTHTRPS